MENNLTVGQKLFLQPIFERLAPLLESHLDCFLTMGGYTLAEKKKAVQLLLLLFKDIYAIKLSKDEKAILFFAKNTFPKQDIIIKENGGKPNVSD